MTWADGVSMIGTEFATQWHHESLLFVQLKIYDDEKKRIEDAY